MLAGKLERPQISRRLASVREPKFSNGVTNEVSYNDGVDRVADIVAECRLRRSNSDIAAVGTPTGKRRLLVAASTATRRQGGGLQACKEERQEWGAVNQQPHLSATF